MCFDDVHLEGFVSSSHKKRRYQAMMSLQLRLYPAGYLCCHQWEKQTALKNVLMLQKRLFFGLDSF